MNDLAKATLRKLSSGDQQYSYFNLPELARVLGKDSSQLPYSIRLLLEGCLRNQGKTGFRPDHLYALADWQPGIHKDKHAVPFLPARVLMQDFTGLPVLNDLTALRSALQNQGKDARMINPCIPSDLVIDHSIQADAYGSTTARCINEEREFELNLERYSFLKWSEGAYTNLRVLPPGLGICHQVNLEYLGKVAFILQKSGNQWIFPDSVLGTDSHTTMINGLGILGWGVGGIEALAAMLGYPGEIPISEVIGLHLKGKLPKNTTTTDLTLTITSRLRDSDVVGTFVEVIHQSDLNLPVETRAMIANMSPESGATIIYFPVDVFTLDYLKRTGRSPDHVQLVETYYKEQGLFREPDQPQPHYSRIIEIDLETIQPILAGPKRPQDIIPLDQVGLSFKHSLTAPRGFYGFGLEQENIDKAIVVHHNEREFTISNGSVLLAAITSCTNTSDPGIMVAAGLLARNAVRQGLTSKPWVKTSFAPGSRVVETYLRSAGLMSSLEALGFHIVGFGCTTCIGNSGSLNPSIQKAAIQHSILGAAVLSGNRNFEGRIHPLIQANYLASPPLVIAYALAGRIDFNFINTPLGFNLEGQAVYLHDIYPDDVEIQDITQRCIREELYLKNYGAIYQENARWNEIKTPKDLIYPWDKNSMLIREPVFLFENDRSPKIKDIDQAHVLVYLGDSTTTDHISPAGQISPKNPAGQYLQAQGIDPQDFISFGARRGNHEVMMRGTFSNPRLRNRLVPELEGGVTIFFPSGETLNIYEAARCYQEAGIPLVILAGKAYGTGSSRDWAAKGTRLLGVRAVIAESFERIHRTNLVCLGVLPLQFMNGESADTLGLTGYERFTIRRLVNITKPATRIFIKTEKANGSSMEFETFTRLDTPLEIEYFQAGGLLRKMLSDS